MKKRNELLDTFIKQDRENAFELFYGLMNGDIDLESLSNEERIIAECVKNECTDVHGTCYELYRSLRKIRESKTKMQIIELYECILKAMCRKMFFHALKLGMAVRKTSEKSIEKYYDCGDTESFHLFRS